jgi:uncharacterized protein YjbI with pentapeptide repeats
MRLPDRLGFRGKTLWDWLQLLIVPAILIAVTFAWSATQTRNDNKREDRRIAADRAAADIARQDATLQAYFDQMSRLMLDRKLLTSKDGDAVRAVARTVTLTALRGLDGERKGEVVRFLGEAELLNVEDAQVVLDDADLVGANLKDAFLLDAELGFINFAGANLAGADLSGSDLQFANLRGANLAHATPYDTDLRFANLEGANLAYAELAGTLLGDANLADTNLRGARLDLAKLKGAKNLDLDGFISKELRSGLAQKFFDKQWEFLVSLSPRELAKFNLTPKKLAKLRREASGR